jgi:hypothetical protein
MYRRVGSILFAIIYKGDIKMSENAKCGFCNMFACMRFPFVSDFEHMLRKVWEPEMPKRRNWSAMNIKSVTENDRADVYVFDPNSEGREKDGCHFRLERSNNLSWRIVDSDCVKNA